MNGLVPIAAPRSPLLVYLRGSRIGASYRHRPDDPAPSLLPPHAPGHRTAGAKTKGRPEERPSAANTGPRLSVPPRPRLPAPPRGQDAINARLADLEPARDLRLADAFADGLQHVGGLGSRGRRRPSYELGDGAENGSPLTRAAPESATVSTPAQPGSSSMRSKRKPHLMAGPELWRGRGIVVAAAAPSAA